MVKVEPYQATAAQIEAAKARREAQQAEKAARKGQTTGGKTVYDKKSKSYVSETPEQAEATKDRREAQLAEKAERRNSKFGGKTIFDKESKKFVSQTSEEVKNMPKPVEAEKIGKGESKFANVKGMFKNMFGKVKGFFQNIKGKLHISNPLKKLSGKIKMPEGAGKITKIFKGKGGKLGLIGLGIGLLVAGGVYLYKKLTGKKDAEPDKKSPKSEGEKPENPKTKPSNPKEAPVDPDDSKAKPTDPKAKPEDPKAKPTDPKAKADNPEETPGDSGKAKEYTVVKGDCVWNIAKKHLKEVNEDPDYKPSNKEILKETKKIMKDNNLEFENDKYHVMIRPKDKLQLVG